MANSRNLGLKQILILSVVLTLMLPAAGLVRIWFANSARNVLTAYHNRNRLFALLEKLGGIFQHDEPIGFVFGASSMDGFFSPHAFAHELSRKNLPLTFYNVAFRSMRPEQMDALADRMDYEAKRFGGKATVSLIRLETARLTESYEISEQNVDDSDFISAANNLPMILERAMQDPLSAATLFFNRYLLFSTSPNYIQSAIAPYFSPARKSGLANTYFRIWADRRLEDKIPWDMGLQGQYGWNFPASQARFDRFMSRRARKSVYDYSVKYFSSCCDLNHLKFSERLVGTFLKAIEKIDRFSDRVVIFYYPELEAQTFRGAEARPRLVKLLEEMRQKCHCEIVDLEANLEWEQKDYYDILHLSPIGMHKLYQALAEAISRTSSSHSD